ESIEAASTKPFGFMPFYPGPGLGGHCIPVDPQFLAWRAREVQFHARFIELATEINASMPEHVVRRVAEALNERQKPIRGSDILLLGLAYKENVSDVRESPALDVMTLLQRQGANIVYHDPHVPRVVCNGKPYESFPDWHRLLPSMDATVILTHHSSVDYMPLLTARCEIVDERGVLRRLTKTQTD
ncbi:MAG: UDP-N-acetyl-D-glucosamine dehydrogenase, partial [Candidatus Poribacteria bacterium]|nr:UDP-N-acetyl-D-glucosamine dehydrogenase [Candidatus Poribacteria bacterium]